MSREVLPQVSSRGWAPVRPGDQVTVMPTELVAGGAAMARINGMPIFIMGLYPGDEAMVRITEVKRGFARAELVQLRRASELRRLEPCPVAGECGGCDWTALRLDHQLAAKQRILIESLRRVGKIDPATLPQISIHASPLNYRLRSRLQVRNGEAGFFALRSHRVVPLPVECEVVGPQLLACLSELRDQAAKMQEGQILVTESEQDSRLIRGFRYAISSRAFFQVNRHLLETLIDLVLDCADQCQSRRRALDLFSGVGFFTLPLATRFASVTGVEESEESHQLALQNGAAYPNIEMVRDNVENHLIASPPDVDLVLLDPPRAGVSPRALDLLSDRPPAVLCYLSCDPVTFSRDAFRLGRRGWRIRSLHLIDLFPNTHHIETFASFRREGAGPS